MAPDLREATEKRRYRRTPVARSACARSGGTAMQATVQDVSPCGARLRVAGKPGEPAHHSLQVGDSLTVAIETVSREIGGRVARIAGDEIGFAFDDLFPEIHATLVGKGAKTPGRDHP